MFSLLGIYPKEIINHEERYMHKDIQSSTACYNYKGKR